MRYGLLRGGFTTPHVAGYTTERATECTPQLGTRRALNHGWRMEIRRNRGDWRGGKGRPRMFQAQDLLQYGIIHAHMIH